LEAVGKWLLNADGATMRLMLIDQIGGVKIQFAAIASAAILTKVLLNRLFRGRQPQTLWKAQIYNNQQRKVDIKTINRCANRCTKNRFIWRLYGG
jgi:hypothetical protein